MIDNLIVALIVGASAWYAAKRYLPARWHARLTGSAAPASGCGTGCSSCKGCHDESRVQPQPQAHVIRLHRK